MDSSTEGEYSCSAFNSKLAREIKYPVRTSVTIKEGKYEHDLKHIPPQLVSFDSVITARIGKTENSFICA